SSFAAYPFLRQFDVFLGAVHCSDAPSQPCGDRGSSASAYEGIADHIMVPGVKLEQPQRQLFGKRRWMVWIVCAREAPQSAWPAQLEPIVVTEVMRPWLVE